MTSMPDPSEPASESPLAVALERVGDRWSLLLVEALLDGSRRFNELSDALPGIAPNILTDRLRRLEREGIVRAAPYTQRPPRMEYSLTADGRDLAGALRLLADWGARHVGREGGHEPLRHATCGTPLEARWYCPTCTVVVEDREAAETRTV
jgi:DNA-binding HxlR family transcriptional regulator